MTLEERIQAAEEKLREAEARAQAAEEKLKSNTEFLKEMLSNNNRSSIVDPEADKRKQEEIESIDESIEKYTDEINQLKTKLENEDNYKRTESDFEKNERPIIESLLTDSIAQEREDIFKSNQHYRKQQEQQTKALGVYNAEINKLKEEIKTIEARLNKDEIAKRRGIAKKLHLSDEEVINLKSELNYKKGLIEEGSKVSELCAEEIRRYGRLITQNNDRLKYIANKERKLSNLQENKKNITSEIDQYKLRVDRDKLSSLESALEALNNRKEFLLYDPSEKIAEQIKQNETNVSSINKEVKAEPVVRQAELVEEPKIEKELKGEEPKPVIDVTPTEEKNMNDSDEELERQVNDGFDKLRIERPDIAKFFDKDYKEEPEKEEEAKEEDLNSTLDHSAVEPENNYEEEKQDPVADAGDDLIPVEEDNEPKEMVDIEDASPELKSQKFTEKVKEAWKKWRAQIIKTTAALLTTTSIVAGLGFAAQKSNEKTAKDNMSDKDNKEVTDTLLDNYSSEYMTNKDKQEYKFDVKKEEKPTKEEEKKDTSKEEQSKTEVKQDESKKETTEKEQDVKDANKKDTVDKPVEPFNWSPLDESMKPEEKPDMDIPKVEEEAPVKEQPKSEIPTNNDEKQDISTPEFTEEQPDVSIPEQTEVQEVVLTTEGEFAEIDLGDRIEYVKYGDTSENVPEEISIKYKGTDMHIYFVTKSKRR